MSGSQGIINRGKILQISVILLLSLWWSAQVQAKNSAANPAGDQMLAEAEIWVVEQVRQGQEADLQKGFGADEKQRRLRAQFLERLLTGAIINLKIPHQGVRIAHATIEGPLNLEYARVDGFLSLSQCIFPDPVIFQGSRFKQDLALADCRFLKSANFKEMQIDGSVSCDNALFEGESLWSDAKINGNFGAEGAEFRSLEGKADFNGLKVGASAFFTAAKFRGSVDFVCAHIHRQLDAEKAEFFHDQETANFNSLKVDQNAYFKAARFHGPVDFGTAAIGGQFNASGAEFLHPEALVNFSGIKVTNTLFFPQAKFSGPVRFDLAEIGVNFRASGAAFLTKSQTANLSRIKVGHKFFGDGTTFLGNVDLSYGEFYELEISGLMNDNRAGEERSVTIPSLDLQGALVQRELKIADARIGTMNASQMQVKGPLELNNIEISKSADFRNSSLQSIEFSQVTWPQDEAGKKLRKVYLGGINFNSISINKRAEADYNDHDFRRINQFIEASPFNTQAYVQLEAFFKRLGRENWANDIFISMHDRELAEKYPWYSLRRWLEWFLWGVLAGYGRAPFRVFFVSLSVILLGAILYDPEHLKTRQTSTNGKIYKAAVLRCFLSLDRFLPVDLGLAKYWNHQDRHFLIWFFFNLELILGWILIPIGLASIYTQIK